MIKKLLIINVLLFAYGLNNFAQKTHLEVYQSHQKTKKNDSRSIETVPMKMDSTISFLYSYMRKEKKMEYGYNPNGLLSQIKYFNWNTDSWQPSNIELYYMRNAYLPDSIITAGRKIIYLYNAFNQLVTRQLHQADQGQMYLMEQIDYTYDGDRLVDQFSQSIDWNSYEIQDAYRTHFWYDNAGNDTLRIEIDYDDVDGDTIEKLKKTFNSGGMVLTETEYENYTGVWKLVRRYTYTYDLADNLTSQMYQYSDNGIDLINGSKIIYDVVSDQPMQSWELNWGDSDWDTSFYHHYVYDSNYNLSNLYGFTKNSGTQQWDSVGHSLWDFNLTYNHQQFWAPKVLQPLDEAYAIEYPYTYMMTRSAYYNNYESGDFVHQNSEEHYFSDINTQINTLSAESIRVYPIPACDRLYIDNLEQSELRIEIFNLQGKLIHTETTVSSGLAIDVQDWAKGLYVLRASSPNRSTTQKIQVQ